MQHQPETTSQSTHPHPPEGLPYEAWMQLMLDFFRQGGEIARELQRDITPLHKADRSIVTKADIQISELAYQIFSPLKKQGHLIVEEESVCDLGPPTEALFREHDFIWAIDPIDGTKAYTMHLPTYAISVGLIYKGRPLMGGVYLPKTDELFIHDGQKANLIENPFSTDAHTESLSMLKTFERYFPFDIISKMGVKDYDPINLPCDITASNAFATSLAHVVAGRTCGSYFKLSLWDMAGAWPLLEAVGAKIIRIRDGQPLDEMNAGLLRENWCIKEGYIACNPAFYKTLVKGFVPRKK